MSYEWNPVKAQRNLAKHGVDFADATAVLEDERALWQEDERYAGEERYIAVGMDHLGRILTVAIVFRGEKIRLISARRATLRERTAYERG